MIMTNFSNKEVDSKQHMTNAPRSAHLKVGSYEILGIIGHGNFSVCKLARCTITNQRVAIKCIEKKNLDQNTQSRIYREIDIMKSLDHQNIIKLNQVMESKSMIYLVCEHAVRGDIFDYISKNGPMNEKIGCKKFCQILSALEYCHSKNIVHRDLKSENLLLDSNMNIKIADFGFSNHFDLINPLKTFCGSPPYAAPEVFCGKKYYGPEVDIWSLGVILYVLISASLPFDSDNLQHLKQKVLSGKFRTPYYISQECEHLISHILVVNTSKRFKLQQIKSHKWIKSNNSSFYYNSKTGSQITKKQSFEQETEDQSNNTSLKVERDKFQSKSLKCNKRSKNGLDIQKQKIALSSLSLPLYSFEECFTGSTDSILTDTQDTMLSEPNLDNISEGKNIEKSNQNSVTTDMKSTIHSFKNLEIGPANDRIKQNEKDYRNNKANDGNIGNLKLEQVKNFKENAYKNKPKFADLSSYSSSMDESLDSGLSSTPLTSSSFSSCSINFSNNLHKFRDFKISQNSLDHYSNHPLTYTRKTKLARHPHRKNVERMNLFKKAFKIQHSKSTSSSPSNKNMYDLSLQELKNLKLSIKNMKHSVCESALNEASTDPKRRSFKQKLKIGDSKNSMDVKVILDGSNEEENSKMDTSDIQNSHTNSISKCKKLLFSMAQRNKK